MGVDLKVAENFSNPMEWIKPGFSIFWSFIFICIFCEFGATIIVQFDLLNDKLIQSNWYLYPIGVQRMVFLLMINAQKSSFIRGFGNIACTREALKRVICF